MIYSLGLIVFFLYSIFLFFINSYLGLSLIFLLNVLLLFILKINLRKYLQVLKINLGFMILIFICNLIFGDLNMAFLTSWKLFLIINTTYIIGNIYTPQILASSFYYLLYPLKIFKVDIKELSLIIVLAVTFIPILVDEARNIKRALLSKGFEFNLKNTLLRPHIYLITYFNSLFERIEELEKILLMKGYQ